MPNRRSRTPRSVLLAAWSTACLGALALPAWSQSAAPVAGAVDGVSDAVGRAKLYIASGRPLHAKETLHAVVQSGELRNASPEVQGEALQVFSTAQRLVDEGNPNELSLERAELALDAGSLQLALQHATAVLLARDADVEEQARATELIASVNAKKAELAPQAGELLAQGVEDFEAGRYASAREAFDRLERSGVELTRAQRRSLDLHRAMLFDLESTGALADHSPVAAGVIQDAGVVRRRSNEPAPNEPAPNEPAEVAQDGMQEIDPIEAALREPAAQDQPTQSQPASGGSGEPGTARVLETMHDAGSVPVASTATYANQPISLPPIAQDQPSPRDFMEPMRESAPPPPTFRQSGDALVQQAMQAEALAQLGSADLAYSQQRWSDAIRQYELLLGSYRGQLSAGQVSQAEANLASARVQAGGQSGTLVQDEIVMRQAQADRARQVFNAEMSAAERALASGDFDAAQDAAARARLNVIDARGVLRESEIEGFERRVTDFLSQLNVRRVEAQQADQVRQERDLAAAADEARRLAEQSKETKIREAIDRVRALQAERRYDEALQVIESQILFLDPLNPTGLLLHDLIRDSKMYWEYNNLIKERGLRFSGIAVENQLAAMPSTTIVDYPEDWPTLSATRLGALSFNEAPADRQTIAALDRNPVQVAFEDNTLADVLAFVAQIAQVDVDADWDSLEEIGVEPETQVSLNLRSATPRIILDRVLDKVSVDPVTKADWAVKDGILQVASQNKLRQDTVIEIYDIRDLIVDIPDYEDAPEIDLQQVLQSGQGGGGQSPFQEEDDDEEDRLPIEERVTIIEDIIRSNVDPDSWLDTGTIQVFSNGSLIIRNTPKNHREIRGLLSKLRDVRAMQINVETRFLLVSQDFFEQVGFDLDVYFNANNNQVRFAQAGDPTLLPSDFFSFDPQNLSPGSPLGLQRTATGAQAPGGPTTASQDTELTQGVRTPSGGFSPIGTPQNSLGLAESLFPGGGIGSAVLSGAPALGIAGQFLDDIQVDFLVKATQADRRSVTLNAPRLTFTNGQVANIYVVTQQSFVSDLQPITSDSAVGFDPTVDVVAEGVVMLVEGTISSDRRYVQMNIDAAISTIDDFGREAVTAQAGGQLVSSAQVQSFIQLPIVTVTRVRTTVTVPDQGTVMLGGQRVVSESEVETGVPVLSKIPILNRFFSNRIESRDESTLMVLVKPTILIQGEQEERAFPGLTETVQGLLN